MSWEWDQAPLIQKYLDFKKRWYADMHNANILLEHRRCY